MAFLEANTLLLIADSGNARIRQFDTASGVMTTWFAPSDRVSPELRSPVGVAVSTAQVSAAFSNALSGSLYSVLMRI